VRESAIRTGQRPVQLWNSSPQGASHSFAYNRRFLAAPPATRSTPMTAELRSAPFVEQLRAIVGTESVLDSRSELVVYECDAFTLEKGMPEVVVLPRNAQEIARIVKLCNEHGVPFMPRGAGTSLSGGTAPVGGGVILALARMNQIVEVNLRDRYAVVEPGVVNAALNRHLTGTGFHYAPDPSSQGACTIGGNVGTNAGGPHTLKYGVTVNHVLGLEIVTAEGEILRIGGPAEDPAGLDLVGTLVGSEGTLAVVTKIWVRLTRNPQGVRTMLVVFDSVDDTSRAISEIIGAGIIPAALEMMDQGILVAVEEAFHFGFPLDAEAVLIVEVDGLEAGLDAARDHVAEICRRCGAREVRFAVDAKERLQLWKARKQAFGAIGRLSPSFCTQDGVVPRTKLPHILARIREIGERHNLRIVNVFHAGDGNLHPILLFDERRPEEVRRVLAASDEILSECIACGGSVTGEHGIGVEKISFMKRLFSEADVEVMLRLRDALNPRGLLTPGKMLPTAGACGTEQIHPGRRAAL
jgi:glycolate oxidase